MASSAAFDWSQVEVAVPGPQLRVAGIQMAGFRFGELAPTQLAMIPHPSVTLVFDLTDQGIRYDQLGRRSDGDAAIGLLSGALDAGSAGGGDCLQIRLSPIVAAAVAPGLPGDTVAPLDALWGHGAAVLTDQLRATSSWDERFALTVGFLRSQVARDRTVAPEIAYAWHQTVQHRGRLRIDALAAETGWSRQRLWSRFRSQVGLSPKRAAQLVRFDHAAHLLAAGHSPAYAAAEAGYVDQPHLHREARAFAHSAPAAVAAAPWLAVDDVAWPDRAARPVSRRTPGPGASPTAPADR